MAGEKPVAWASDNPKEPNAAAIAVAQSTGVKTRAGRCCNRWCCCCGPVLSGRCAKLCCCCTWTLPFVLALVFSAYWIVVGVVITPVFTKAAGKADEVCKYSSGDSSSNGGRGNSPHDWRMESPKRDALAAIDGNDGRHDLLAGDPQPNYFDASPYLNITEQEYELVAFTSRGDGVRLLGWLASRGNGSKAVNLTHGHSACKSKYDVLMSGNLLWMAGYTVFLIDLRNSGDSARKASGELDYTFGLLEYQDTLGAWDYLQAQGWGASAVGLWGGSMGGSTTLIALASEPLVACAWLDSMMCVPKQSMKNSAFNEVATLRSLNGTGFGSMLFDSVWMLFNAQTPVDLDGDTALALAPQLAASQAAYFVSTVGDMTTGWKETKDCYEAAQKSPAGAAGGLSWHQYDDRADFATGTANGVYSSEATNNFDTHMQAPLYYTDDYAARMTGFFAGCLA